MPVEKGAKNVFKKKPVKKLPPVPLCEDNDESSLSVSFCMPASITAFQMANMKTYDFCVYHKIDNKIIKLNDNTCEKAYLYISPADKEKLTTRQKNKLYQDGVKELYIYKQREGSLRCEHVDTKMLKEKKNNDSSWIIETSFCLLVFFIIVFLMIMALWQCNPKTIKNQTIKNQTIEVEQTPRPSIAECIVY